MKRQQGERKEIYKVRRKNNSEAKSNDANRKLNRKKDGKTQREVARGSEHLNLLLPEHQSRSVSLPFSQVISLVFGHVSLITAAEILLVSR